MPSELKKSKVVVTLTFEEYLRKFFNMWYDDAEVLAKLLGMEDEEEEVEDWIEQRVKNVEILKAANASNDYSKLSSIPFEELHLITKAVDDYSVVQKEVQGSVISTITKMFGKKEEKNETSKDHIALPIMKSVDDLQRLVTFICYEPDVKDAHGNWATADVIKAACDDFNTALAGNKIFPNLFHHKDKTTEKYTPTDAFSIVKSYVTGDDCYFGDEKQLVTEGTWLIKVKFESDALWDMFLAGTVKGISIGCKGLYGNE